MAKPIIFIDGEAGTTGLQIRDRLSARGDLELLSLSDADRKNTARRTDALLACDVAILCLPDDAAREAVALGAGGHARFIDASTAHRTAPDWIYGFPELAKGQREAIAAARYVSNPGCFPTGFLALIRPLVDAEIVPQTWPVSVNAVSGYTGGGKAMIAEFEDPASPSYTTVPFRLYGLPLKHKHVPEMQRHAGLANPPLFAPSVGRFAQGMLVEVPLHLSALPRQPRVADVRACLAEAYAGARFVEVASAEACATLTTLDPEGVNGTNRLRLFVFGDEGGAQARLVAQLDNLGKGASGAAVQDLNLMLGVAEDEGLR